MSDNIVKPVASPASTPAEVAAASVAPATEEVIKKADEVLNRPADDAGRPYQELIPTDHYLTSPLFHEIANFFSVDSKDYESVKDKLSAITDFVIQQENSNKLEDVMLAIRKLEDNIQPPAWGEKRYNNIYRYIRLAAQKDAVSKAMSSLERNVKYA